MTSRDARLVRPPAIGNSPLNAHTVLKQMNVPWDNPMNTTDARPCVPTGKAGNRSTKINRRDFVGHADFIICALGTYSYDVMLQGRLIPFMLPTFIAVDG